MSVQAAQHFNLSATLRQVVRESLRVLHADRAALFLRPPNGDALRIGASVGLSQNYLDAVSEKWKELPVGRMLRRPKLCFWANAWSDQHFKVLKAEIEREGYWSFVNVPLLSEGVFQGWLALYFDEVRSLSDEEKSTIQAFADLAAVAIENSRLYEREREASRQLDRLQELALRVSSSLRPSEVLESIAKTTVELLDWSQSRIYLLEAVTDQLICKASHGITTSVHDAQYPMKVGMGVGGEVARSRKPHISPDVQKNPKWLNVPWVRSLDLHSFICVPLLSSGEVLGIINCLSQRVDQFGDADLRLLESLAGHAAIAIEKAQHVESLKARIEEREGLVGALGHVASGLDVETIIQAVLSESARVMGTNRCSVMLPDPQSGDPRLFTSQGISSNFVEGIATLPEPFPLGRAYLFDPARAEPTVISDVQSNTLFGEVHAREGHRSLAAFPLRLGNRNIGVLFYFWTAPQTLDDQQLLLGQAFAEQVAIAIENATLYR